MDEKIRQFLDELKQNGRSSPAGIHWHQFYELLQSRKAANEAEPPVPLILGASGESNAKKHERLAQQLEWALKHGVLDEAIQLLRRIPFEHWNRGPLSAWMRPLTSIERGLWNFALPTLSQTA